ncbi:hypothetical protein BS78_06G011900 [Paspalum vaginatum]|nr:hypothetical protein BS78_06G011900 [Paspalum vaginatum]
MPITASTSTVGSGKLLGSASAIVAGTESGQHLLKIDGYSRTKEEVPTGSDIKSQSFRVGGHGWHICYYANGLNSDSSDYISVFLELDHFVPQGVRAQFTFSLLGHGGTKPVPHYTLSSREWTTFRDCGVGYRRFIKRDELEKSEYLKDDCFTIRCDFTVIKEIQTMDVDVGAVTLQQPPAAVAQPPPSDLHRHLRGLLATGEGADVTFEVDGRTFAAHRYVLMARSPVFHAELSGVTKGGEDDCAADAIVKIQDMEAPDFEALLYYMYTDSLPEMEGEAKAMLPDLVAAANRYKMERLKLVCEYKLSEFVDVKTVATILAFAEEHHCLRLKEACLQFLDDPANLKDVVKALCLEHLGKSCPSVLEDLVAKFAASP